MALASIAIKNAAAAPTRGPEATGAGRFIRIIRKCEPKEVQEGEG
jgi:hypothetical protein